MFEDTSQTKIQQTFWRDKIQRILKIYENMYP